jgi:hypothetical protein
MKKSIAILSIISFVLFSFNAPTVKPDPRLIDYLGNEKLAILQKNNPNIIVYYNYFLDNSYILSEVPQDKINDNNLQELTVPLEGGKVNIAKLNLLMLNIQYKQDQRVYYSIKNSKQILVMLSGEELMEKYNQVKHDLGYVEN